MSRQPKQKVVTMPFTDDPNAANRKKDHINLAFQSQIAQGTLDERFYYEPLLAAHPKKGSLKEFSFLGKTMKTPLWVSSMTGGTLMANTINHNLAKVCGEFGMGMGLGSCRQLLRSDEYLKDFAVRKQLGDSLPLYANLGIAQLEQLLDNDETYLIDNLLDKLSADGLIIHINPLQEWLQPEGDRFLYPPIETIMRLLDIVQYPIIIKEVGQGFGYHSLKTLLQLPIAALDFAANGGTNFAKLELLRSDENLQNIFDPVAHVGHTAADMVNMTNDLLEELGDKVRCKQIIISGGIKTFLDGYYLTQKLNTPSIYGQASGFLKHAMDDYETLYNYVDAQVQGLELANAFLKVR